MRLKAIAGADIQPIKNFQADDLSNVVVIAGPNGIGKSRLLQWVLNFFQQVPSDPKNWIQVEATSLRELVDWDKKLLDTRVAADAQKLKTTLQKNRRRNAIESSLLNFESDRKITQVKPYQFTWDAADPYLEEIGWNFGFGALTSRYQDTVHTIFRKIRSRSDAISRSVLSLATKKDSKADDATSDEVVSIDLKKFPDPTVPFKNAFSQLLAPKTLVDPDPKRQKLEFLHEGKKFEFSQLSSGEREVVNIVFDFLLRNPSDCVVIFDEPELHLHPELSYRLLQTLKTVGERNQFIFCTHSAEIISASLDNSVIFIQPPDGSGSNQAVVVRENDETNKALKLIGQSVGIVSLGKKIVLIEGAHGSLDKETYGAILKGSYPDLALVPSGGRDLIRSFATLVEKVLDRSVWGVEFFMLCDRDAVPTSKDKSKIETAAKGRLQILTRYHLENYFLDEVVISKIFEGFEKPESWLRSPQEVRKKLKEIAHESVSYAAALIVSTEFRERVGNVDLMPKACHQRSIDELVALIQNEAAKESHRVGEALKADEVARYAKETMELLERSFENDSDDWKSVIPGRTILSVFCSSKYAGMDFGRFKTAYINAASGAGRNPFSEIEQIFAAFSATPART